MGARHHMSSTALATGVVCLPPRPWWVDDTGEPFAEEVRPNTWRVFRNAHFSSPILLTPTTTLTGR